MKWRGEPVPTIYERDGCREPSQFCRSKLSRDGGVILVCDVMLREARQQLSPCECSLFALREDARFTPGYEKVQFGGRDAKMACFIEMKLRAEGAAIDLRGAYLDELLQLGVEPGGGDGLRHRGKCGVGCGGVVLEFLTGDA